MSKPNYANYPKVKQWLQQKGYEFHEFNNGTHLRILGDGRIVDLWPGRMTYHIVEAEDAIPSSQSGWPQLSRDFNPKELAKILTE